MIGFISAIFNLSLTAITAAFAYKYTKFGAAIILLFWLLNVVYLYCRVFPNVC